MNTDVLLTVAGRVAFPALLVWWTLTLGFRLRWHLFERSTRRSVVRAVTAVTWLLVVGLEIAMLLRSTPLLLGFLLPMMALLLLEERLPTILARPDARLATARSIDRLNRAASDPTHTTADDAAIRKGLDDLDYWKSPATFEAIELTRMIFTTWLWDPADRRHFERWSARLEVILRGWNAAPAWNWLSRIGAAIKQPVRRFGTWLALIAGVVAGAAYHDRLDITFGAILVWAYVSSWDEGVRRAAFGCIGFGFGLLWWTAAQGPECAPTCDPVRFTRIGVAAGALILGALVSIRQRRRLAAVQAARLRIVD